MTSSLLTCWTQRCPLTTLALADEHVRRAEPLAPHGRCRRRRLPSTRRPRTTVAAEAVQGDVDRLAAANGDAERTRARVGADGVAEHVERVTGSGRGGPGDVRRDTGVVERQRRVARGRRRVHDCHKHTYTRTLSVN